MDNGNFPSKWLSRRALRGCVRRGTVRLTFACGFLGARLALAQTAAPAAAVTSVAADAGIPMAVSVSSATLDAGALSVEPSANGAKDEVALRFAGTCAGCHTVGGGNMRGPDLVATASWAEPQLTAAIQSMQRKVGPLAPGQISALVGLLKDPNASERIKQARAKLLEDTDSKAEPPNSLVGGALFFGKAPLENGGLACNSCHRFHAEGGDLGPDLSDVATNVDIESLAGSLARAGFPVMRAAYQAHPITLQEARHIAAFLRQARADRQSVMPPPAVNSTGLGAGMAAFACALLYIALRPKGVRARLVQRGIKR